MRKLILQTCGWQQMFLAGKSIALTASSDAEIEEAFHAAAQQSVGALFVNIDTFLFQPPRVVRGTGCAIRHTNDLPAREFVEAGGLMSYGSNFANALHQSGAYAGNIIKGAKPTNLPVLQPTKIELVINLKTAKSAGHHHPALASRPRR